MKLAVAPITLREANAYVVANHRHHGAVRGCLFCIAAVHADDVHGVAIIGRPVSRLLDDGTTAEVTRLATDGARNAASMLLRAAWRAASAMGFRRMVTYTLPSETGASLRGAGFRLVGKAGGGSWSRAARPRVDLHPMQEKLRWEVA